MRQVREFNKDYDAKGIRNLKAGLEKITNFCARGIKCHINVIGGGHFFVLCDEASKSWYMDETNWKYVSQGSILIFNIFKNNAEVINEVLKVIRIVDDVKNEENFRSYDEYNITRCETMKDFIIKFGPQLFDHKRTRQPKKQIREIFMNIIKKNSTRPNFLKKQWEFRFFSTNTPNSLYFERFLWWASQTDPRISNVVHVFHPILRFCRRILFVPNNQREARLKGKTIKISYATQDDYDKSMKVAIKYVWGIGKQQDKSSLERIKKKMAKASLVLEENESLKEEEKEYSSLLSQKKTNGKYNKKRTKEEEEEDSELTEEEEGENSDTGVENKNNNIGEVHMKQEQIINGGGDNLSPLHALENELDGDDATMMVMDYLNGYNRDYNQSDNGKKISRRKRRLSEVYEVTALSPISTQNDEVYKKKRKLMASDDDTLTRCLMQHTDIKSRLPEEKLSISSLVCFMYTEKIYSLSIYCKLKNICL